MRKNIFFSYEAREGDCIPVIDETGRNVLLLEYQESRLFNLFQDGELDNKFFRLQIENIWGIHGRRVQERLMS